MKRVTLMCIQDCFQPVGQATPKRCEQGVEYEVEVEGNEPWLRHFNAYDPSGELIDFEATAPEAKPPAPPTLEELGAGPQPSVEKLIERFGKEGLLKLLKPHLPMCAKWGAKALAKNVIKRQLYVGKMVTP